MESLGTFVKSNIHRGFPAYYKFFRLHPDKRVDQHRIFYAFGYCQSVVSVKVGACAMLRIAFKQDGDSGEWFASLVGYGAGYGSPRGLWIRNILEQ